MSTHFPELTSPFFAKKSKKKNYQDPIYAQYKKNPTKEKIKNKNFTNDPTHDQDFLKANGLLQKYNSRALIITTNSCAINCRYCFRRYYKKENTLDHSPNELKKTLNYLKNDKSIHEIILSGGDPMMLKEDILFHLISQLDKLKHITTIRIHSRVVTVLPQKISTPFIKLIKTLKSKIVFVSHVNHPNELDKTSQATFEKLKKNGVCLLNQSVLLKNINDSPETIIELNQKLFSQGVLPYYIHQLDKVQGSKHFEVSLTRGKKIMKKVRSFLPGYLVPRYVQEINGHAYKDVIF